VRDANRYVSAGNVAIAKARWTKGLGAAIALGVIAAPASGQGIGPPAVTAGPASSVSADSARLRGTVNPNGADTTYKFQYGPTTGYGSSTPPRNAGGGLVPVPVKATLSGLEPGATYHFRLIATNASGTSATPDATFVTSDPRIDGRYAMRVRIHGGAGPLSGHDSKVRRVYRLDAHCDAGVCPTVHLKRQGRRGTFGSVLRRESAGVYSGTERFKAGRCDNGLRFTSVASIRVAAKRLTGERVGRIGGRLRLRVDGCVDGREHAHFRGSLIR
jgi:hypothetical protein